MNAGQRRKYARAFRRRWPQGMRVKTRHGEGVVWSVQPRFGDVMVRLDGHPRSAPYYPSELT
jgi:hypothetical protein